MADTEQTIDIIFNGVDRTAGAISSVIGGVEDGTRQLRNIAQPIANVTAGILKFEAAVLTSGAAMTAFAVKTAGDFDAAFREISTLVDAPIADLQTFRAEILDYAGTSTQSMGEITTAIYGAISAGVDYTDSLQTVRTAEQLAVASKADLGDTLTLLVSSLNAYGASADEAGDYSDDLFTTVKQGQTTLPELAGSLAQVTGIASGAGVSFSELLSAVASLTAAGLPTSQAVTSIKAALSNILKPTAQAADEADRLGIEFNASALKSKGLEGVLQDVAEATGGNVDQMAKLFGSVEGLNGVIALTGNGAEKFADTLKAMEDNAGATTVAFDKMAEAIGLKSQVVENALKAMLTQIGTPLLDEFGGVADAIAAIFNAIGESVDEGALGSFTAQIEQLAQDMESALREVAQNLPEALAEADFSAFLDGIQVLKDAVFGLFDGVDLTSTEGLTHAIEVVGSGFLTLQTFVANTIEAVGPFLELLADLAGKIAEMDPELVKLAGSIGGIAIAAGPVLTALTGVSGAIKAVANGLLGATGLTSALRATATVLSGPAGVAVLLTGLATAAYKAGENIYGLTDQAKEYNKIQGEIAKAEGDLAKKKALVTERLKDLSDQTGINITSLKEFNRLTDEGVLVYDEAAGKWKTASQAMEKTADSKPDLVDWSKELEHLAVGLKDTGDTAEAQIDKLAAYYESQGNSAEVARQMAEMEVKKGKAVKDSADAADEATKKSEAYRLKLLEIASDERIQSLEIASNIKVAEIEADAEKTVAAFDSISSSIGSVSDVLGDLTGDYLDADTMLEKFKLDSLIDDQNERQDKLINAQVELTNAQREYLEAKTQAIENGDGEIKIDSSGLEPALELVLWQILEKVQVKATEENANFLLGIGSGTT